MFFPLFTCFKKNNPPNHTFLISKRTRENITKNGQFGLLGANHITWLTFAESAKRTY